MATKGSTKPGGKARAAKSGKAKSGRRTGGKRFAGAGGGRVPLKPHYSLENSDMMLAKMASDRVALQALGAYVRAIGFPTIQTENGIELAGISRERVLFWSDGLKSIEKALTENGIDPGQATHKQGQVANWDERRGKHGFEAAEFIPWWRSHNRQAGFEQLSVEQLRAAPSPAVEPPASPRDLVSQSVAALLAESAVIDSHHDILVSAIESSGYQSDVDQLLAEVGLLIDSGKLVELEGGRLVTEQTARHLGALPVLTVEPLASHGDIRSAIEQAEKRFATLFLPARLTGAQRQAVFAIAATDSQLSYIDAAQVRGAGLRAVVDLVELSAPQGHSIVHVYGRELPKELEGLNVRSAESALHDSGLWGRHDVTVFVHDPQGLDVRDAARLESIILESGTHVAYVAPTSWITENGRLAGISSNPELYAAHLEGRQAALDALELSQGPPAGQAVTIGQPEASDEPLRLTDSTRSRDELNLQLRQAGESASVCIWEPSEVVPDVADMAPGDLLHVRRRFDGLASGEWLTVYGLNPESGTLTVERKQGDLIDIDVRPNRHRLTHGRAGRIELAQGEVVRVTTTMPSAGIRKGERARVVERAPGRIVIETMDSSGRQAELVTTSGAVPIDYGYAWAPAASPVGPSARSNTVMLYIDAGEKPSAAMVELAARYGAAVRVVSASQEQALTERAQPRTAAPAPLPLLGLVRSQQAGALFAVRSKGQILVTAKQAAALGGAFALDGPTDFKAEFVVTCRKLKLAIEFADPVSRALDTKYSERLAKTAELEVAQDMAPPRPAKRSIELER